jgi:hypothetical protein
MDTRLSISRARLETAEALLREVLAEDYDGEQTSEARTLGRMLVHIVNMHQAVSNSTVDDANVARRLGDFAKSMSRVTPPTEESGVRFKRLTDALISAKAGLEEKPTEEAAQTS